MSMALMFESWGISHDMAAMLEITGHHRGNGTALQVLNRYLFKAYHPDEIPTILRQRSPVLGGSILDYLCCVDNGAEYIIEIIDTGP